MTTMPHLDPTAVVERMRQALNQHDIEAFVACFAADYASEQPNHPDRAFRGSDQVRKNWSAVFEEIPDFRSEILRTCATAGTVWTEWHWTGTLAGGEPFNWRGVTISVIHDDRIALSRLYMAPVQASGPGIDAVVQQMTRGTLTEP
jgi:ketosteroid isomerase-like protein